MTYLLTLTLPIAFPADDDDHARVIAEHIDDVLASATLPHGAEVLDAPSYVLKDDDGRVVVGEDDFVARYAPFPVSTGQGHPPCAACQDYIAASHTPGDHGPLAVELDPDDETLGTRS